MSQTAHRILAQVSAAGGDIVPVGDRGDRLRLIAPAPLPDDLVAAVKAHKPEILDALRRPQCSSVSPSGPADGGHAPAYPDSDAGMSLSELMHRRSVVYVRSRVLGEVVAWATDGVEISSRAEVVYREMELCQLVGRSPEEVRAIHAVKHALDGELLDDEVLP